MYFSERPSREEEDRGIKKETNERKRGGKKDENEVKGRKACSGRVAVARVCEDRLYADSLRNVNVNRVRYVCPVDREINHDDRGG